MKKIPKSKALIERIWKMQEPRGGDYGMFTLEGDQAVHKLVMKTKKACRGQDIWARWRYIRPLLDRLAQKENFREVGDTDVRNRVVRALWLSKQAFMDYHSKHGWLDLDHKPEGYN